MSAGFCEELTLRGMCGKPLDERGQCAYARDHVDELPPREPIKLTGPSEDFIAYTSPYAEPIGSLPADEVPAGHHDADLFCEWEHVGPDFDGTTISVPCGGIATKRVQALDLSERGGEDAGFTIDVCDEHAAELTDDEHVDVEQISEIDWPADAFTVLAQCRRCDERFVPGGADDMMHGVRESGAECGGSGDVIGAGYGA